MTTYTHNEIAVPGGAQWYDVNIDGNNPITRTSTLFVLPNSDGTATHIIGSDFTYDANGNPTGGLVTQIDRTSSDGATVYETVTGLEPIYLYYTPLGGSDAGNPLLAFAFENDLVSVFSLLTAAAAERTRCPTRIRSGSAPISTPAAPAAIPTPPSRT